MAISLAPELILTAERVARINLDLAIERAAIDDGDRVRARVAALILDDEILLGESTMRLLSRVLEVPR